MGYRSDVRIMTSRKGFDELKKFTDKYLKDKNYTFGNLLDQLDLNKETKYAKYIGWNSIKWYEYCGSDYEDVNAIMEGLQHLKEKDFSYRYARIGESYDDYDEHYYESEKEAKSVAIKRKEHEKSKRQAHKALSLDELFDQIKEGRKEINILLKTDVKGSEEAVKNALLKITVEGVKINVIRSGVGTITESDVVLANASNAIIIGFNVSPSRETKETAKNYNVEIRLYNIIYKLVEEIEAAMKGMLDPEYEEIVIGEAEVRQIFHFSKVGSIAGSHVTSGIVKQSSPCRVIRDGIVLVTSKIASLQREKNQVKEVKSGFDCGMTIENFPDIKERDVIEVFEVREVKKI